MRNKKIMILLALVLVLVMVGSFVMVACTPKNDGPTIEKPGEGGGDIGGGDGGGDGGGTTPDDKPKPKPPKPPKPTDPDKGITTAEAIMKIVNGATTEGGILSMNVMGTVKMQDDDYTIELKGNFVGAQENEFKIEIKRLPKIQKQSVAMAILAEEAPALDGVVVFGVYVINEKAFVKVEGGPMLHLSDFNMNYLISIIGKGSELLKNLDLDKILNDLDTSGMISSLGGLSGIIDLLLSFLTTKPVYVVEGVKESLSFDINLTQFLTAIKGLLGTLNIQGVDMNAIAGLIDGLNRMIPDLGITVAAEFENTLFAGKGLTVDAFDKDGGSPTYGENLFALKLMATVSSVNEDIEMPEINDFQPFSLTNIAFDIDLLANSSDATGAPAKVDIGRVVNSFTGKATLPENQLLLDIGLGFRLSVKLDLDLDYEKTGKDNNLISIELFILDRLGEIISEKPQLGLYYMNGAAYVNVSNTIPNYYSAKSVRIDANIDGLLNALIKLVTDAIDKGLGTNFNESTKPVTPPTPALAGEPTSDVGEWKGGEVVSVVVNGAGDAIITPAFSDFVKSLASLLKLEENIIAEGNQIKIIANNKMLEAIDALAGGKVAFRFPETIGDIVLDINLSKAKGLDDITINGSIDALKLKLKIHNFLIGYESKPNNMSLRTYIELGIGDVDNYTNSLASLIQNVLTGVHVEAQIKLDFEAGTYDLAPFIAGFGVPQFAGKHLLWTFSDPFLLDATLKIQVSLDKENHNNSNLCLEIIANENIAIGKDILFEKGKVVLGVYGYQNVLYVDASNIRIAQITLPKLSAKLDFTAVVYKLLGNTDYILKFNLEDLLKPKPTPPPASGEGSEGVALVDPTQPGGALTEAGKIIATIDSEALSVSLSLSAILGLLKSMNVAGVPAVLDTIKVDIDLSLSRLNGIKIDLTNLQLVPRVQIDAEGEYIPGSEDYTYKTNLHLEAGTPAHRIIIGKIPQDLKFNFVAKETEFKVYSDNLIKALVGSLGKGTLIADVNLKTLDEVINITDIVNNVLASRGEDFKLPINLHLDDWDTTVQLGIYWNLNIEDFYKTEIKIEIKYEQKTLLELDIIKGAIVLDLRGLGLFNLKITNSPIVPQLIKLINGAIKGFGDLDLTKIINDALGDLALGGGPAMGDNPSGDIIKKVNAAAGVTDGGDKAAGMDIFSYIIDALSGSNAKIMLKMKGAVIDAMLRGLLGFGLGIDLSAFGELDVVAGTLNLNLSVNDIDLAIKVGIKVGTPPKISDDVLAESPEWDASTGARLAETMLDNLDIGFYLDIANYCASTIKLEEQNNDTVTDNNKYYTRVIIEKLHANKPLKNSYQNSKVAQAESLLITLAGIDAGAYNNTDAGHMVMQPLVYIELNYKQGQTNIYLCEGVLNLVIDFAQVVNISLDRNTLDLVKTLGTLFDGLLEKMAHLGDPKDPAPMSAGDNVGGIILADPAAPAPAPEPSGFAKIFAELDVMKLLGGGIDAYLTSTGLFKVNLAFDPFTMNKLIDDVMGMLFGPNTILDLGKMAPEMFGNNNYLAYVNWNRFSADETWLSLKKQLTPLLRSVVKGINNGQLAALAPLLTDALLNSVYYQIRILISRLLPFCVFNEMSVGLNLVDGTVANVSITAYDNNQDIRDKETNDLYVYRYKSLEYGGAGDKSVVASAGNGARNADYFFELFLYNTSPTVGAPGHTVDGQHGIVTWGDISRVAVYEPYMYADENIGRSALKAKYFTNKVAKYQEGGSLYKTDVTFQIVTVDSATNVATPTGETLDNIKLGVAGTYTVRATASFNSGKVVRTFDIELRVYGKSTITAIGEYDVDGTFVEGITRYVYQDIPAIVTVRFAGLPERRMSTLAFNIEGGDPTDYKGHTITATAVFNSTNSSNAKDSAPIKMIYKDSTVKGVLGGKEINVDLYEFNLDQTPDPITGIAPGSKMSDFTPPTLYFQYAGGFADKLKVESWDTSLADPLFKREVSATTKHSTDVSGGIYVLKATVGTGLTQQVVDINFNVKTKVVESVEVNGFINTLKVNPYQYYMYMITGDATPEQLAEKESYNPYPNVVKTTYNEDITTPTGVVNMTYSEDVNVVWGKESTPEYDWNNNNRLPFTTSVGLDTTKYKGSFTWSKEIKGIMTRNEIQNIYFDEAKTKKNLVFDPYLYQDNKAQGKLNFPDWAWVEFTNGVMYKMPIAWKAKDVAGFKTDSLNNKQFIVTIGFDPAVYGTTGLVPMDPLTNKPLVAPTGEIVAHTGFGASADRMLQTYAVNVRVDGLAIESFELPNNVLTIDPVVKYTAKSDAEFRAMALPKTLTAKYVGGGKQVLSVEYDTTGFDISISGGKGTIYANAKGSTKKIAINVEVIDRSKPLIEKNTMEINPYDFTVNDRNARIYSQYTDKLAVKYDRGWKVVVTKVADLSTQVFEHMTQEAADAKVLSYTGNAEFTATAEHVFDKFDLPVRWDRRNEKYSYKGTDPVAAGADRPFEVYAMLDGGAQQLETFEKFTFTVSVAKRTAIALLEEKVFLSNTTISDVGASSKKETKMLNVAFVEIGADGQVVTEVIEKFVDGVLTQVIVPKVIERRKISCVIDLSNVDMTGQNNSVDKDGNIVLYEYTCPVVVSSGSIQQNTTVKLSFTIQNF